MNGVPDTAVAWVLAHALRTPDAPAVDSPWVRLTYRQLAERVMSLAGELRARGVSAGSRVIIALPLSPAAAVAALAVQALSACVVEVDRETGAGSLTQILSQTEARHVFVFGQDARKWVGRDQVRHFFVVHPSAPPERMLRAFEPSSCAWMTEEAVVDGAQRAAPLESLPAIPPDSAAAIVFTSGSTGTPRGVVQTFRNIAANTRSIVAYLGLSAQDRALLVLPLHYCYGKSVLQTHLLVGGSTFLDPRFMYPAVVLNTASEERVTGFAGVPLTFELLKRQAAPEALKIPSLRYVTQAGGAMAPETIRWARRAFAPALLYVMYGQTEATARLAYLPPGRGEEKCGSIGVAIPGVVLKVVDENGAELSRGEAGHLVARGANVTPGYLGAPEETAAILKDGWLWTGDLATRDADGFFFIVGRAREMLKVGGHRVSPAEIEAVLARHPEVLEVAVVGIADALGGEAIAAAIVPVVGKAPSGDEMRRFARESLPANKVPRVVVLLDALPRGPAGKVLKAELRSRLASEPSIQEAS